MSGREPWELAISGMETEIRARAHAMHERAVSLGVDVEFPDVAENEATLTGPRAGLLEVLVWCGRQWPDSVLVLVPVD